MSESHKSVWICLPGEAEPTLAGRCMLAGTAHSPVGLFDYDPAYLALPHKISLDQGQLLRFQGQKKTTDYRGLFGIFRDAKPDGFGLDMLHRRVGASSLSDLDALEHSAGDAVGAVEICDDIASKLNYRPRPAQDMFEIMEALDPAQSNMHVATRLEEIASTSLGGERPKVTVQHQGQQWIAKFAARTDASCSPLREYLCMKLAALSGICTAQVEFAYRNGRGTVMVQRFDRHTTAAGEHLRLHFASGATVLGASAAERDSRYRTYLNLGLNAMRWGVQNHLPELWRRMAFNVLVGNGDDHPRNHGLLRTATGWQLSPAYDIAPYTPNSGKILQVNALSMGVLRNGDAGATADNLLRAASDFGVDYAEANDYLDQTYQRIHDLWDELARTQGQKPLVPPAFQLPARGERLSAPVGRQGRRVQTKAQK